MPTRGEMQSLAEEIVRSYEDRISAIAQLRQAESERNRAAAQEMAQRKSEVGALFQEVGALLQGFDAAHAAMSRELEADLAQAHLALVQQDRKRQGEARQFKGQLARAVAEGKAATQARLKELDAAHAAMSRELEADLAKVRPALVQQDRKRQSEAREFMGQLAGAVAEGKAATQARLKELASIEAGARDEWQKLAATMQANRGAPAVEVKPPVAVAPPPVREVAPPLPVIEEMAEEEAVARAEVAEITPELATLRDRVFAHLADHPDGTRLVEMEQEFGRPRIQMARVVRSLMDEGKVEKRGLLYFAI